MTQRPCWAESLHPPGLCSSAPCCWHQDKATSTHIPQDAGPPQDLHRSKSTGLREPDGNNPAWSKLTPLLRATLSLPRTPNQADHSDRSANATWLQGAEQSLPQHHLPCSRTPRSPEPLTGQASGRVPTPQQRPGSQQHCIFVILPGSSCAQRPFTRPEKHVPVLWSDHAEIKNRRHDSYLLLLLQPFHIIEASLRSELLCFIYPCLCYLSSICFSVLYWFTWKILTEYLFHIISQGPKDKGCGAGVQGWCSGRSLNWNELEAGQHPNAKPCQTSAGHGEHCRWAVFYATEVLCLCLTQQMTQTGSQKHCSEAAADSAIWAAVLKSRHEPQEAPGQNHLKHRD